jgi:hypothetical protein
MSINWKAPLVTGWNEKAEFIRELKTDDEFPMLVLLHAHDGSESAEMYRRDGTYSVDGEPSGFDLCNAGEVRPYAFEKWPGVGLRVMQEGAR